MTKGKRKRTSRSASEKMRIALKGMEPGIDVASLCRQEGISPTQYYSWKSYWYPVPMPSLEGSDNDQ